jgi:hypothetical protein
MQQGCRLKSLKDAEDGKSLESNPEMTRMIILSECLVPSDDEIPQSAIANEIAEERTPAEATCQENLGEVRIRAMGTGTEMARWHGYGIDSQGMIRFCFLE